MKIVLVYIPNSSKDEADKLAKHLLERRLIGCANIFPISSMYWWKGKITNDNEVVLIAKTTEVKFEEVKAEVEKVHPYDTPCILRISADVTASYFDWLNSELK